MKKIIITVVAMMIVSIAGGIGIVKKSKIENKKLIVQEEVENIKQEDEKIAENNFEEIENKEINIETEAVSESSSTVIDNQTSSVSKSSSQKIQKQEKINDDKRKFQEEEHIEEIVTSKQEEQTIQETPKENKSNVTTAFYDSITGGKKEFSSESTCRARGMILLGFGIVQVGLSLKIHDTSQRANGFLTVAGGIIITFAKEILNMIAG